MAERKKYEKQCIQCSGWFVTEKKRQECCGIVCGQKRRSEKSAQFKPCEKCGKEFRIRRRAIGTDANRFCSRECGGTGKGKNEWKAVSDGMLRVLLAWKACDKCGCSIYRQRGAGVVRCETCTSRERWRMKDGYYGLKKCKYCGGVAERNERKKFHPLCLACKAELSNASSYLSKRAARLKRDAAEIRGDGKVSRRRVFLRDSYICQICGIECDTSAHYNEPSYPTIDHIVPLSKGGMHEESNLQCACRECNSSKSDSMPTEHTREGRYVFLAR